MSIPEVEYLKEKRLLERVDEFLEMGPHSGTFGRQLIDFCHLRSHFYIVSNGRISKRLENERAILLYVISILKRRSLQGEATSLHDLHCLIFDRNQIQRYNNFIVSHSALKAYFCNSQRFCNVLNSHALILDSGQNGEFVFIADCKEDQIGLIGHYNTELNVYLPLNYQENALEELIPTELEVSTEKLCVTFVDRLIKNRIIFNIERVGEFCSSRPHLYLVNNEGLISITNRENREEMLSFFATKIKTSQDNLIKVIICPAVLSTYHFNSAKRDLDVQLEKSMVEFLDANLRSRAEGVQIERPLLHFYSQRSHRYEVNRTEGSVILRSISGQDLMTNIIRGVAIHKKKDISDLYDFMLNEAEGPQRNIVTSFLCDVVDLEALLGLHEHIFRKISDTSFEVTGWFDPRQNIFLPYAKGGSRQLWSLPQEKIQRESVDKLYRKALWLVQTTGFTKFSEFSRVKKREQWVEDVKRGYETKYSLFKTYGNFGSPIKAQKLNGLMFATLTPRGAGVTRSPKGTVKLVLPAGYLLPADEVARLYFADFFCQNGLRKNRTYSNEHRVTLIVTRRGTKADQICELSNHTIELNTKSNEFLKIQGRGGRIEYFTRAHVWIDVFFTENAPVDKANLKEVEWVECHPRDHDLCEYCTID